MRIFPRYNIYIIIYILLHISLYILQSIFGIFAGPTYASRICELSEEKCFCLPKMNRRGGEKNNRSERLRFESIGLAFGFRMREGQKAWLRQDFLMMLSQMQKPRGVTWAWHCQDHVLFDWGSLVSSRSNRITSDLRKVNQPKMNVLDHELFEDYAMYICIAKFAFNFVRFHLHVCIPCDNDAICPVSYIDARIESGMLLTCAMQDSIQGRPRDALQCMNHEYSAFEHAKNIWNPYVYRQH
jgi:hypothetical protein